jgi:uncharacterized protein (DUF433 family)
MQASAAQNRYIQTDPALCGGEPILSGTRIPVRVVVGWTQMGKSVDEIAAMYPNLTHAMIHDALSFYYDHREWIDRLIEENELHHQMAKTAGEPWRKQSSTLTKT